MNQNQKSEIIRYLAGPRDYSEGVALYTRYGVNRMLKKRFMLDENPITRSILAEELRKLSGLSEAEFRNLPRRAVLAPVDAPDGASVDSQPQKGSEIPESVRKALKLRDRFPFLKDPSCPDKLKIAVADMFAAWDQYRASFAMLSELPEGETPETLECVTRTVEGYLVNREIWEELEYYAEHGQILGRAACMKAEEAPEPLSSLSDLALLDRLNTARASVSRLKIWPCSA